MVEWGIYREVTRKDKYGARTTDIFTVSGTKFKDYGPNSVYN
jgi:hypothetical protein